MALLAVPAMAGPTFAADSQVEETVVQLAYAVDTFCGIWGLLAVTLSNPKSSLVAQLAGITTIFSWCFGTSFVVWLLIKGIMGIRVGEEEELEGVDVAECGLAAYPEFTKE